MNNTKVSKTLFWVNMVIAQIAAFIIFKELAYMSQWVVQGEREDAMTVWYNRFTFAAVALGCMALAIVVWFKTKPGVGTKTFFALVLLFAFNFYSGLINPQVMMRPRHSEQAVWVSIEEAKRYMEASESVIVYELEGVARAHSDKDSLRPHVIGGPAVNGKEVVMTYCGLTNLGMAYVPEIDGQKVELAPINQLENNLVMVDRLSGEPVQQLWGKWEADVVNNVDRAMKEVATFRMPFEKFAAAYPEGQVFVNDYLAEDMRVTFWENPFLFAFDNAMDFIFTDAIIKQKTDEEPVFPTIKHYDDRLANKTLIWGFNIGEDYVAYTEEFVRQNGNIINTTVGGEAIIIAYDEQFDSLGVFYNTTGQAVEEINFFGEVAGTKLTRVETVKAGAFWLVWANFFPQTDLNRA